MTTDKRVQATSEVLDHVERAREALKEFQVGARVQGVLASPHVRAASPKRAQEELRKAIAIIERTKWRY